MRDIPVDAAAAVCGTCLPNTNNQTQTPVPASTSSTRTTVRKTRDLLLAQHCSIAISGCRRRGNSVAGKIVYIPLGNGFIQSGYKWAKIITKMGEIKYQNGQKII